MAKGKPKAKGAAGAGAKAKTGGAKAKQVREAKEKKIENATFGMKNKSKSKKVQQKIQNITKQYDTALKGMEKPKGGKKDADGMAPIFKPLATPGGRADGVDPKSILCQYFKAGTCTRGNKCRYSHDLDVERKAAKIDLYTDRRDIDKEPKADTMDDWDEETLRSVVEKKSRGGVAKPTAIVCKFFLAAIDSRQYGWFWECPNGAACQYRHALPPGYVMEAKVEEAEVDTRTIAQILEEERVAIKEYTQLTHESFVAWIEARNRRRAEKAAEEGAAAEVDAKAGPLAGMTGRAIFAAQPSLFADDDAGAAGAVAAAHHSGLNDVADDVADDVAEGVDAPVEEVVGDASLFVADEDDDDLPDFSSDDEDDE